MKISYLMLNFRIEANFSSNVNRMFRAIWSEILYLRRNVHFKAKFYIFVMIFFVKRNQIYLLQIFLRYFCAVWSVFFVRSETKSVIGNKIFYLKQIRYLKRNRKTDNNTKPLLYTPPPIVASMTSISNYNN